MHPEVLTLLTSREESLALLKLDGLVDLIIPRGSNALVQFIQDNTRIPVLGHADGIAISMWISRWTWIRPWWRSIANAIPGGLQCH